MNAQIRYEVIKHKIWRDAKGHTASIFGALPWWGDKGTWDIVSDGWTLRDNKDNTIGCGRPPFKTEQEAQAMADKWNNRVVAS